MGKKAKLGKFRKDKFYKLAKETGFRSRAAFKLIQLNRKFGFLQESQVCIDLCAAPGGWMQVAKQNMPVSSIVIGIDLYPIKPIPGCISLVADITTDKCKTMLNQELKTWKADVVLHDGAPNVGKNWLYDAYQQNCLTLNSVKLASQFLRKGGWFVTKVFRSKDYNALLWVLKQLFKKVHATKPSASRKESAEIFVACQGYLAPDKIDPKLLDVKYVFEELDLDSKAQPSLLHPEKQKRIKAEGYTEKDFSQRTELSVTEFMQSTNGLSALQGISSLIMDHDGVRNHPRTTQEILECCKDIKVLGRKDIKGLLLWWKHIRADLFEKPQEKVEEVEPEPQKELTQDDIENMEFEELEKQIAELADDEARELKRKRKKILKERAKLNEKMNLKMVIKGDEGPREEIDEIFELKNIRTEKELDDIQDVSPDFVVEESKDGLGPLQKYKKYDKDDKSHLDDDGKYDDPNASSSDDDSDSDADLGKKGLGLSDEEDGDKSKSKQKEKKKKPTEHPLLKSGDFRDKDTKRNQRAQLWFEKEKLQNLNDDDEDFDLDRLADEYKTKGVKILSEGKGNSEPSVPIGKKAKRRARHDKDGSESSSDESSSGDESEDETEAPVKKIRLTEEELALGAMMVKGRKTKRDLIDMAWNRYTFDDTNLPVWFVQDEEQHMRKPVPVPAELSEEYEKKVRELNVRPIKKVMEAKARKKRRVVKRIKKAKKQAEQILENADNSAHEKARQLRKLYKKAEGDKKKEISYVVAKKHLASKRVRRPPGVKGHFKVVDPRMKKEKRAQKSRDRKSKKKGKGKGRK
ncbi:pre-rRNA 2'-O-ribose RNA methyltransferase FTSJ3 [Hermetia illucens]|uniref:pre-rRNA 2'-O-ribose RNA methyltransferase FTSJ3 n=1 Tax=Hermetia illucens TaxID=343691 RepID=UPI0018CC24BE|nr:pre-rRNA 2'-O-ribose RNA methyltransferase FTSJ3 [Hermetia illucens]